MAIEKMKVDIYKKDFTEVHSAVQGSISWTSFEKCVNVSVLIVFANIFGKFRIASIGHFRRKPVTVQMKMMSCTHGLLMQMMKTTTMMKIFCIHWCQSQRGVQKKKVKEKLRRYVVFAWNIRFRYLFL